MSVTIEEILTEAVKAGASDVHIVAGTPPWMRVNGRFAAMAYPKLFAADTLSLLVSVMTEAQRNQFEQCGEYDVSFTVRGIGRFRASAYKQSGSAAMVLRPIGMHAPSSESLGIPEHVMELSRKESGLILVAGPSGSGRTTTLAALIDRINSIREAHILTLEHPIEYVHPHKLSIVSQREVGTDCGSYASGLRAALREDADVIMAAELSDTETICAALTAAETGSLVLSTLHTTEAAEAVERIADLFLPHQQRQIRARTANVLEAVIFQQLVPDKKQQCRKASFEVLHVTPDVRELLRGGRTEELSELMKKERKADGN
ncbi:MAG: PilT/PilU family type 4a pilus ATPase [Lachnospiraceae bacterium]|nr:PilT/PilU family type 4a pilus ATPase [Lachnospiraceae bacterium]